MPPKRSYIPPWNNWFHCVGTTYGAWLRGDPRGWRARHHKAHVPYDYKSPPPKGAYDRLLAHCRSLMKRDIVILSRPEQELACQKLLDALHFHNVEVLTLCVSPTHFHVLCRFIPLPGSSAQENVNPRASRIRKPRHLIGIAKKESARALSAAGLRSQGGIWAVRCKCKPIRDRRHQLRAFRYIRAHFKRNAVVWTLPPPPTVTNRRKPRD